MARFSRSIDSEDDLPELSSVFQRYGEGAKSVFQGECKDSSNKASNQYQIVFGKSKSGKLASSELDCYHDELQRLEFADLAHINSSSLPIFGKAEKQGKKNRTAEQTHRFPSSPRRKIKSLVNLSVLASSLTEASVSLSENDDSSTDLSGFIVPDSASEDDSFLPQWQKYPQSEKFSTESRKRLPRKSPKSPVVLPINDVEDTGPIDLTSPEKENGSTKSVCPESPPRFRTARLSDPPDTDSGLEEPISRLILCVRLIVDDCKV